MKKQKQQQEEILESNKGFRNMLIVYMDIVIRSLISFFCVGIVFSVFLISYLHISWVFVLPLVFFVSVLISPLLSQIRLSERILVYYENLLKKSFNL